MHGANGAMVLQYGIIRKERYETHDCAFSIYRTRILACDDDTTNALRGNRRFANIK